MMKTTCLPLMFLSLLLSACSGGASEKDFSLELYLKSGEKSKDSNSGTEILEMDGTQGNYSWSYEGYHPDEDFERENEKTFELSPEEIEALKLFIQEQGLNQDLTEEQSQEEMGRTVELTLMVDMNGVKTKMQLSGMSETWSNGGGPTNLEHFAYVEAAQYLIYTVKDLGGFYED